METERNGFLFGLVATLLVVTVFVAGYFIFSSGRFSSDSVESIGGDVSSASVSGIVFYYGEECPHCHTVLDFLREHDIASSVRYDVKEIWHDRKNSRELFEHAKACGYASDEIGVPFLYADGKCLVGAPDVIGYFSEQAGIQVDRSAE